MYVVITAPSHPTASIAKKCDHIRSNRRSDVNAEDPACLSVANCSDTIPGPSKRKQINTCRDSATCLIIATGQ